MYEADDHAIFGTKPSLKRKRSASSRTSSRADSAKGSARRRKAKKKRASLFSETGGENVYEILQPGRGIDIFSNLSQNNCAHILASSNTS